MKTSRKSIDRFLAPKKLAIAGVSRDPKKFGYTVFNELRQKGFDVVPVNPNAEMIDTVPCYKSIESLPEGTDRLLIVTHKRETDGVLREAVRKGIRNIWIQQMSDTQESLEYAAASGLELVSGQCILMWADPVKSIHRFHRTIKSFFGLLPK
ncbi:MAG TPA: CoA-binding protein [Bacteroidales bacterium]|nr:CoA-binding protein [Bacteroidales bacterium]